MGHFYCVVYRVYGIFYHYRCYCKNSRQAKKWCRENMGVTNDDIWEVYIEDNY